MKKNVPDSLILPGHADYPLLMGLADEIVARAEGEAKIREQIPIMLRECIDDVVNTPRTGRRSYDELEKTEKTYIGTRVEIMLRFFLNLKKGKLDTVINGHDVDIKHTMGSNWMIPTEAIGHPCILVAADEVRELCFLGIIIAREQYLTRGGNKDSKKTISADGFKNILWILRGFPYPKNFWKDVSEEVAERIFAQRTGNEKVAALFREIQEIPVSRDIINGVARQKDFMRRTRGDNGRGPPETLLQENILMLSGTKGRDLIRALELPDCGRSDFISYRIRTDREREIANLYGIEISDG